MSEETIAQARAVQAQADSEDVIDAPVLISRRPPLESAPEGRETFK